MFDLDSIFWGDLDSDYKLDSGLGYGFIFNLDLVSEFDSELDSDFYFDLN